MKAILKSLVFSAFVVTIGVLASSCQKDMENYENVKYASILDVANDGTTVFIDANVKSALVETAPLADDELTSILEMKDEEKLARDVYSALSLKWGGQVFSRISTAENNHLNAILILLKSYGSVDTLIGDAGVFENVATQALYNDLVEKASVSLEEAYQVGALIEEMDIKDISELVSNTTNENVVLVFENLLKGSRNHLRAFNLQLTNLGITYTPVYISQDEYTQIVTSAVEKGQQYKMQGNGNNSGVCTGTNQGQGNSQGNKNGNGNGNGNGKRGR